MHGPSRLTLPGSAAPPYRPLRQQRGTLRLGPGQLGVARRDELLARGHTDWSLRTAVESGELRRIARGWFALPTAQPDVLTALLAGYRLTCVDAASLHGLWVPHRDSCEQKLLHIHRPGSGPTAPPGLLVHSPRSRTWPETDAVASLPLALEHALRCQSGETSAILLESAMEHRLLTPAAVQELVDGAPSAVRSRIGMLSTASDSGSETRVVRWLRRRRYLVEQQVFVEGVGFIDAYVGGVFLEIDGRSYHSDADSFGRDRRRDLRSIRHGLQVLRLSYEQVWHQWESTKEDILSTIEEVGAFGRRKVEQLAAR